VDFRKCQTATATPAEPGRAGGLPVWANANKRRGTKSELNHGSAGKKRWSQHVTETSDALSLEPEVFTFDDPARIARALSESAEESTRRKSGPFRSAMSMLTFYINRAGGQLATTRRKRLEQAKEELRKLFGKAPRGAARGLRR
jgi:hypothetical protein